MPRETRLLATELAPGDHILETGLAGISGRVTAVRVGPKVVDVTLSDGARHALGVHEVCQVERELRAEAA